MGSLFVLFGKKGIPEIREIMSQAIERMAIYEPGRSRILLLPQVGLGCSILSTTPESVYEELPFEDRQSGCYITCDTRLDHREELASRLGMNLKEIKKIPDSRLILSSYLKWGKNCLDYLYGDFAFVIYDRDNDILLLARDRFGCRPLYFIDHADYIAISSNPVFFDLLPQFRLQIKEQYILDAICSIVSSSDSSAFKWITRLEPAHYVVFSANKLVTKERYWDLLLNNDIAKLTEEEAIKQLRERFLEVVRQRGGNIGSIGLELSGGLDSSSIGFSLDKILTTSVQVDAFSHNLSTNQLIRPPNYSSEIDYSEYVVNNTQIKEHYKITGEGDDGSYSAINHYLESNLKPPVNIFAAMSDILYKTVKDAGINVLISGFGGDEGVSYQGAGLLEELVHRKDYGKLREIIGDKGSYIRILVRLTIKEYLSSLTPGFNIFQRGNWRESRFELFAVRKELSKIYNLRARYLDRVTPPVDPDTKARQYKLLMHPYILDRLEDSHFAAQSKGIEYRYPFLDVKLIEFVYSINSLFSFKNGINRYIFREAMKGVIPDLIRLRNDKTGATIPNVRYRIIKDEKIFKDIIEEARHKNSFHYVDYDKLTWLLNQLKEERADNLVRFSPKLFLSPMSVLILQKWQQEGKIDIGIKI